MWYCSWFSALGSVTIYFNHQRGIKSMWSNLSEAIVREFGERASVLRTLHTRQAQSMLWWDRLLFLPSLMCSMTSAAIQTTADPESEGWKYAAASLAVIAGMLTATSKHLHLSERAEMHKKVAGHYATTYRLATTELAMDRGSRTSADALLTDMRQKLDTAGADAPIIERRIVNGFMTTFKNPDDIALPEVCNGLKRIKIRSNESE